MAIQRGEIYFIDFGPPHFEFGPSPERPNREPAKERPVVVLSINPINQLAEKGTILLVTVVPGTSGSNVPRDHPWQIRVPPSGSNLLRETVFRAFQIRAIDSRRFPNRVAGRLQDKYMEMLDEAVSALGLPQ